MTKKVVSTDHQQHSDAHEKLLSSLEQLTQVLDIMGKVVGRLKQQADALPKSQSTQNNPRTLSDTHPGNHHKKDTPVIH
ncbi:MAG: hypothetical protein KTR20_03525 [Cellvibrionaceae bacterium]|nr:hypothetical protein [Cellvibrionaceae bacterium]